MVTIKKATLLLINHDEQVIKRIPASKMTELVETQELNAADQLTGTIISSDYLDDFKNAEYVAIADNLKNEYHVFAISNYKFTDANEINFSGISQAQFELDADGFIQDRRFRMADFAKVVEPIFTGSRWTLRKIPADIPVGTINFYFTSRLEALKKVIEFYDVDVQFSYEIKNNQITHRYVDIYGQLGTDTGKRFAYGSNLLSIVKETSTTDLYTAIVPRGDGIAKQDENGQDTGGYSRKIDIKDIEWKKADGHPVDKPKGQYYLEAPDRTAIFGLPNGKPKVLIKDFDGVKDPNDLIRIAYLDLLNISRPKIQFSTSITQIGDVQLGDAVTIVLPKFKIEYKTRIFKLTLDLLTGSRSVAQFGDYLVKTAYEREYDMWLKQKQNQENQDDINDQLHETIVDNKNEQDKWNTGQEDKNKEIEQIQQQIQKDVDKAAQEIGDYIKGQDQLGEIIFTGKDMLPTRGNIYNIVARSLIDGKNGELIFNSNGLGWYGADGKVKMAITNNGRVIADQIYNNYLESLEIKTAHLLGGLIEGVQFLSKTPKQYMSLDDTYLRFGFLKSDGSKDVDHLVVNPAGMRFIDNIGGTRFGLPDPIGKKGELTALVTSTKGFEIHPGHHLGQGLGLIAADHHVLQLCSSNITGTDTDDEGGEAKPLITISSGGEELAYTPGSGCYYNEGIYINNDAHIYTVTDSVNHGNPFSNIQLGYVDNLGLHINKKALYVEDM